MIFRLRCFERVNGRLQVRTPCWFWRVFSPQFSYRLGEEHYKFLTAEQWLAVELDFFHPVPPINPILFALVVILLVIGLAILFYAAMRVYRRYTSAKPAEKCRRDSALGNIEARRSSKEEFAGIRPPRNSRSSKEVVASLSNRVCQQLQDVLDAHGLELADE